MQNFGVRERYLWDLAYPDPADPVYKQFPPQFRTEFHDRLVAPIYPIAFTVHLLRDPRRAAHQPAEPGNSRSSWRSPPAGALRMIGFACNVFAAQTVIAIYVLYASLALALASGIFAIARGSVIEPPAFLTQPLTKLFERVSTRLATS